jgi:hypothetical protein
VILVESFSDDRNLETELNRAVRTLAGERPAFGIFNLISHMVAASVVPDSLRPGAIPSF